jgi:cell division protein FtsB
MKVRYLTALTAFLVLGSLGCDPSKEELEKTKTQLTTVSAERDGLKSQLDQANAKVTALTQQVTDLQGKLTAAATPPPAAAEPAAKPAGKPAAKKGAAKPLTTEQKKEIQAHPETRSGAGHF